MNIRHTVLLHYEPWYKGGSAPPPQPDPMRESEARMAEERQRAQMATETAERDRARVAEERTQRIANNTGRLGGARNNAESYGRAQLAARGLGGNDYGVFDLYRANLDRAGSGYDASADTFVDPFSPSQFEDAYGTARGTQQRNLRSGFNEFAGDGFADTMFTDEMDDPYLDAILGQQRSDAQGSIDQAYARGKLNDSSKQYANQELERSSRSGRARLEDMGLGVLQGYRNQATNEAGRFNSRIDDYDLGDDINLDNERHSLDTLRGRLTNRLEGDIYNTVGGTELFDTNTILGKAGQRTGVTNLASPTSGTGNLSAALSPEDEKTKLGSSGAF